MEVKVKHLTIKFFYLLVVCSLLGILGPGCSRESKSASIHQPPQDSDTKTITRDFFGVQAVGNKPEHYELMDVSFSILSELGIGFIAVDSTTWQTIEPNPPINGIHNYNWDNEDIKFNLGKKYGLKIQATLNTRSDWATIYPNDYADEPCCDMFPLRVGYENDWRAFVRAYIERYYDYGLREITLGNEINAPSHFIEYGGTPENYEVILSNAYQEAKEENSDIIVSIGFASTGSFFDDNPSESEIKQRRNKSPDIDKSISFLEDSIKINKNSFDVYPTQCNDHYTGIIFFHNWVKKEMQKNGYEKPISCEHTMSTQFIRKGGIFSSNFPPYYPDKNNNNVEDIIEILTDSKHPDFQENRKTYFADQAKQTVKKLTVALSKGRERAFIAMSVDPYNCQVGRYSWEPKWCLTGLIDTREYCNSGNILKAKKPAYYSYKLFINRVLGSEKEIEALDLGDNVYAYKFIKNSKPFFIIWHEDMFDVDADGLVKKNQQKRIDLSYYVLAERVKVTHIVTELDRYNDPIYPSEKNVPVDSIIVDETPVFVEENGARP